MFKLYSYCAMFKLFVVNLKSKEVFGVNLVFNCRNRVGGILTTGKNKLELIVNECS